jgi:hypothetical protein
MQSPDKYCTFTVTQKRNKPTQDTSFDYKKQAISSLDF